MSPAFTTRCCSTSGFDDALLQRQRATRHRQPLDRDHQWRLARLRPGVAAMPAPHLKVADREGQRHPGEGRGVGLVMRPRLLRDAGVHLHVERRIAHDGLANAAAVAVGEPHEVQPGKAACCRARRSRRFAAASASSAGAMRMLSTVSVESPKLAVTRPTASDWTLPQWRLTSVSTSLRRWARSGTRFSRATPRPASTRSADAQCLTVDGDPVDEELAIGQSTMVLDIGDAAHGPQSGEARREARGRRAWSRVRDWCVPRAAAAPAGTCPSAAGPARH